MTKEIHVFMDTNIYLSLLDTKSESVKNYQEILNQISDKKIKLYLTEQVKCEFKRNREKNLDSAISKYVKAIPSKIDEHCATFLEDHDKAVKIKTKFSEINKLKKDLVDEIKEKAKKKSLETDHLIQQLFNKATLLEDPEEKYFQKAYKRFRKGNPPGKSQITCCDQLNWEILIGEFLEEQDLHFITNDGDYYSILDRNLPSEYLEDEWKERKKGNLFFYRSLTNFMKAHLPKIQRRIKQKVEELIKALQQSGSFEETHSIISKFPEEYHFSKKEKEKLLSIFEGKEANKQIAWIKDDPDVSNLHRRILGGQHILPNKDPYKRLVYEDMKDVYKSLNCVGAAQYDGAPIYLSDGVWLYPDGTMEDRGR